MKTTFWRIALALGLVLTVAAGRPTAQIGTTVPQINPQFFDNTGLPLNGGLLYTCQATTSCPGTTQATYSDSTLSTPNANPVVLNSSGRPTTGAIFLSQATYKFVLQTSAAVTVWTLDNVAASAPWNLNTLTGKITYTSPSTLTVTTNAITPTQNVHTVDTSGGAANLNTIATTNVSSGFVLILTGNNPGANPVTVKDGAGNISLPSGDFILNSATKWISLVLKGSTWYGLSQSNPSSLTADVSACDGRLTLTTATPVTTADVTGVAATTLYFTPYRGNTCYLYDGSTTWNNRAFTETTLAVPNTTSQMYDMFLYDNSGTPALEALAWTNDTARATALTTQNGVLVKTGVTTRRYIGSFRTGTVAGQTEDSVTKRYVWNYYNRVSRQLLRQETTGSWNYTTATIRQANASTSNQVDVVVGWPEVLVNLNLAGSASSVGAAGGTKVAVGIGEDSTTVISTSNAGGGGISMPDATVNGAITLTAFLNKYPAVGRHLYQWLEWSAASGTTTFYGTTNGTTGTPSGISGWIQG